MWRNLFSTRITPTKALMATGFICFVLTAVLEIFFVLFQKNRVTPTADIALLEIATRHAISFHRLTGPYSRFGWDHPGPMYFYVQALPYLLLHSARSLTIGALMINIASGAAMLLVVGRKLGTSSLLIAAATLGVMAVLQGNKCFCDCWNPTVLLVPTLCFVVSSSLSRQSLLALAVVVVSGTFMAQTHASTTPIVFVGFAIAITLNTVGMSRSHVLRTLGYGGGLAFLLWLPPLYQEVTGSPGNLSSIYEFTHKPTPGHSLTEVTARLAQELWSPTTTMVAPYGGSATGLSLTGFLCLCLAGAFVGWKLKFLPSTLLSLICLLSLAVASLEASRAPDELYAFIWFWIGALPYTAALSLFLPFSHRLKLPSAAILATTGAIALAGCGVAAQPTIFRANDPDVGRGLDIVMGQAKGKTNFKLSFERVAWPWALACGIANELDRAGLRVHIPIEEASTFDIYPSLTVGSCEKVAFLDTDRPSHGGRTRSQCFRFGKHLLQLDP